MMHQLRSLESCKHNIADISQNTELGNYAQLLKIDEPDNGICYGFTYTWLQMYFTNRAPQFCVLLELLTHDYKYEKYTLAQIINACLNLSTESEEIRAEFPKIERFSELPAFLDSLLLYQNPKQSSLSHHIPTQNFQKSSQYLVEANSSSPFLHPAFASVLTHSFDVDRLTLRKLLKRLFKKIKHFKSICAITFSSKTHILSGTYDFQTKIFRIQNTVDTTCFHMVGTFEILVNYLFKSFDFDWHKKNGETHLLLNIEIIVPQKSELATTQPNYRKLITELILLLPAHNLVKLDLSPKTREAYQYNIIKLRHQLAHSAQLNFETEMLLRQSLDAGWGEFNIHYFRDYFDDFCKPMLTADHYFFLVQTNQFDVISFCLNLHPNITLLRFFCGNLLHLASFKDKPIIVAELLRHDKSWLNNLNHSKNTALHLAAMYGHVKIMVILLNAGANVDIRNEDGDTPIMLAAQNGHMDCIHLLIKRNASLKIENKYNETLLHKLATQNDPSYVALIIAQKVDIDLQCKYGPSALFIACHYGQFLMAQTLLKCGANVDEGYINKAEYNIPPLMIAVKKGYYDIARLLIDYKANKNIVYQNKIACEYASTEKMRLLTKPDKDIEQIKKEYFDKQD